MIEAIDQNGNGEIDIEDVIILGLKTPGVRISRSDFLRQEFFKRYPKATIDDAIAYNPAHAGIPLEEIDEIADSVIQLERVRVSGIATAIAPFVSAAFMIFFSTPTARAFAMIFNVR